MSDLCGLRALRDDHSVRRRILVSRCEQPERTDDGIDLLPWQQFVDRLWGGEIV